MNFNFRAWDKSRNLMIDEIVLIDLYHEYIGYLYANEIVQAEIVIRLPINDVVLMQSTGLYDSNGKEIYEWDIVEMKPNVYADPQLYLVFRHYGGEYRLETPAHGCPLWLRRNDVKVVGNVFENPELMDKDFVDMRMKDVERWRGERGRINEQTTMAKQN